MSWPHEMTKDEMRNYFVEVGRSLTTISGQDFFFALDSEKDFLRAYRVCPPLKAIIGKRAKAFNSGKLVVVNHSTGKPATGRKDFYKLLDQPNVLQSQDQFFAQQNIYIDVFGYCPVLTMRAAGMEKIGIEGVTAIWNLPPWLFDLDYTNKWLAQYTVEGIYKEFFLNWNGERIPLKMEDVRFIFDDGIGTDNDINLTIPDSRLVSLEYPVSNIVAAYKSRNTLITKRGAIGIISNENEDDSGNVAMRAGEKETLQKDFAKYGLTGQPFQVIISDAKVKWQQMGFPTKDLMLFEEIQDDLDRLCDAYGYPAELIARSKDTTFDNKKQARKDFIENAIVPETRSRMCQFTRILLPDDGSIEITRDFSKLTLFQEDTKLRAEARSAVDIAFEREYNNNLVTLNQWREAIGLPSIEGGDSLKGDQANPDPLAVRLGVGGTTALINYLSQPGDRESKVNGLQIIFGLSPEDAERMVSEEETKPAEDEPKADEGK